LGVSKETTSNSGRERKRQKLNGHVKRNLEKGVEPSKVRSLKEEKAGSHLSERDKKRVHVLEKREKRNSTIRAKKIKKKKKKTKKGERGQLRHGIGRLKGKHTQSGNLQHVWGGKESRAKKNTRSKLNRKESAPSQKGGAKRLQKADHEQKKGRNWPLRGKEDMAYTE